MALRREIDDGIDLVVVENAAHGLAVSDVPALEAIVRLVGDRREVCQISRIGQLIVDDDVVVWITRNHVAGKGAADKTSATRHEDIFQGVVSVVFGCVSEGCAGSEVIPVGTVSVAAGTGGSGGRTKRSSASANPSSSLLATTS